MPFIFGQNSERIEERFGVSSCFVIKHPNIPTCSSFELPILIPRKLLSCYVFVKKKDVNRGDYSFLFHRPLYLEFHEKDKELFFLDRILSTNSLSEPVLLFDLSSPEKVRSTDLHSPLKFPKGQCSRMPKNVLTQPKTKSEPVYQKTNTRAKEARKEKIRSDGRATRPMWNRDGKVAPESRKLPVDSCTAPPRTRPM